MTTHLRVVALVLAAALVYGLIRLYIHVLRSRVLPAIDPEIDGDEEAESGDDRTSEPGGAETGGESNETAGSEGDQGSESGEESDDADEEERSDDVTDEEQPDDVNVEEPADAVTDEERPDVAAEAEQADGETDEEPTSSTDQGSR